jgi:hypothetical protein
MPGERHHRRRCSGMDVFYTQADTAGPRPARVPHPELRITNQSLNPSLYGSITAHAVHWRLLLAGGQPISADVAWADNRAITPSANANEDIDVSTDSPGADQYPVARLQHLFQKVTRRLQA